MVKTANVPRIGYKSYILAVDMAENCNDNLYYVKCVGNSTDFLPLPYSTASQFIWFEF